MNASEKEKVAVLETIEIIPKLIVTFLVWGMVMVSCGVLIMLVSLDNTKPITKVAKLLMGIGSVLFIAIFVCIIVFLWLK